MFQDHALFPHRDVGENVAFGLRMQGRSAAEQQGRADELLAMVGLAGMARRRVQTLSGGEQQRVALARALAPAPRVLLLDEPLGALDRPLRERLVGELRALFLDLHISVLAVTHDHREAFALADRLVLVDRGRVLQTGSPTAVWARPASRRVAELLGFPNIGPRPGDPKGDIVAVRPEGVHLDPAGPLAGRVQATTFTGSTVRVVVALDGGGVLEADVPAEVAPAIAGLVRLRVDPDAVVPLDP
jgi:thiamine transport system ATP-binding protein